VSGRPLAPRHPADNPAGCELCKDVGEFLDKLLEAFSAREAETVEDLVRMGHVLEACASWWAHRACQMTGGDPAPVLETIRNVLAQNGIDANLIGFDPIPPTRH
jgi:hypothetical protein